jgi:predicted transposase YbfD/YdcC
MERFAETVPGVIAIDGKTLRRSFDRASGQSPLHLVSAWAADTSLMLGQIATDAKSNEITAVPKLLAMLSLKGMIVTADAMSCQRAIARRIVDQGGDYVMAVKSNQPALHDDVRLFLDDPAREPGETDTTVDGGNGRIDTRTATVSTDVEWLRHTHKWPGLTCIGKIHRTREYPGQKTQHTAYYILSKPMSAKQLNQIVRAHWGIENTLHWVLDVTMNEDWTCNRKDHGPSNIALLRRWALNAHRMEASKGSVKGKLKQAGWDDAFLARVLTQSPKSQMRLPCPVVLIQIGDVADLWNRQPPPARSRGGTADFQRTEPRREIVQLKIAERLIAKHQHAVFVDGVPDRGDAVRVDGAARIRSGDLGRETVSKRMYGDGHGSSSADLSVLLILD